MQKDLLQPLSGFRDYNKPTKGRVVEAIRSTFVRYGFQYLETPSLERQEVLLDKLGQEGQKQLYLFNDNGNRPVGLRYDLTVSLARFVAANLSSLALPYKRYEVGNVWRAERAQKGRLRQFTQADIDIIGTDSISAEKELLKIISEVNKKLSLNITCLVNDRRLADALMDKIKIDKDKRASFLQIIDKSKKISNDNFNSELSKLGLSDNQLKQARLVFLADDEKDLESLDVADELNKPLEELVKLAESAGLKARIDLGMVRGLDYYTGTIIEVVADDYPSSLVGGGRYDDLVEQLIGKKVPAVGISFGVDRITELLDSREGDSSDTLFFACLPETEIELRHFADELRESGKSVEVYLDSSVDLAKQLKYGSRQGYKEVYLPFESDWKAGRVTKKDMDTGDQSAVERKSL